jgi:phosphatidylglycerophosphate synthase
MLDTHRDKFSNLESLLAKIFKRLPLSPNAYTLLSFVAALAGFAALLNWEFWLALAFFVLAFLLDLIDGAVARTKGLSSPEGAYWDTISDRYVEAILLFGLLFVNLPQFYLPSWAWIFLALFGAMMTTYAKSAAKEKGLSDTELKGGLMSRAERLLFLALIIILLNYSQDWAVYLLALLAILSNFTACQRILTALRK